LKQKGMKLDFGAIGKGYSANKAKLVMEQNQIRNGIVNAGGDLISWGKNK
jgi:thiamine biosynthesis lipoprotein